MKQLLLSFLAILFLSGISQISFAQCNQPASQIPDFSGTVVKVDPNNLASVIDNDGNYTFNVGDCFRYVNVVTSPSNMNAYIYIEAISNASIVMFDNNAAGVAQRFQPRISPNPSNMNSDQEGYVQFKIEFRQNTTGLPLVNLSSGLRFRHFDMDGYTRGTTGYFRETGWTTGQNAVLFNSPSNLTDDGNYTDGGFTWRKILGQTTEHDGVSSDADVYYTSVLGATNVVRFRMGYKFVKGNGGNLSQGYREYAAEFGCFDISNNIPLPVKLVSFKGNIVNDVAKISWESSVEDNIDGYIIQRSYNGTDFSDVGTVQALGRGNVYTYNDPVSVSSDKIYYRLKIQERSGDFSYSNSVLLKTSAVSGSISAGPNPFKKQVQFSITASQATDMTYTLISVDGRQLKKNTQRLSKGTNTYFINDLESLQTGIYFLQVQYDDVVKTIKLLKN